MVQRASPRHVAIAQPNIDLPPLCDDGAPTTPHGHPTPQSVAISPSLCMRQSLAISSIAVLSLAGLLTASQPTLAPATGPSGRVCDFFGWVALILWATALAPQAVSCWQRGQAAGLSLDFALLTCLTAALAFISSTAGVLLGQSMPSLSPAGSSHTARAASAVAAAAAAALAAIVVWQGMTMATGGLKPTRAARYFVLAVSAVVAVCCLAAWGGSLLLPWHAAAEVAGYTNLVVTPLALTPQVSLNHAKHSTAGFSMWYPLLLLGSGVAWLVHHALSASSTGMWEASHTHILALLSLLTTGAFACVLLGQHFLLYGAPATTLHAAAPTPTAAPVEAASLLRNSSTTSLEAQGALLGLELGELGGILSSTQQPVSLSQPSPVTTSPPSVPSEPAPVPPRPTRPRLHMRPPPLHAQPLAGHHSASVASMDTELGRALAVAQI